MGPRSAPGQLRDWSVMCCSWSAILPTTPCIWCAAHHTKVGLGLACLDGLSISCVVWQAKSDRFGLLGKREAARLERVRLRELKRGGGVIDEVEDN